MYLFKIFEMYLLGKWQALYGYFIKAKNDLEQNSLQMKIEFKLWGFMMLLVNRFMIWNIYDFQYWQKRSQGFATRIIYMYTPQELWNVKLINEHVFCFHKTLIAISRSYMLHGQSVS